jgi:hypothetical protein
MKELLLMNLKPCPRQDYMQESMFIVDRISAITSARGQLIMHALLVARHAWHIMSSDIINSQQPTRNFKDYRSM